VATSPKSGEKTPDQQQLPAQKAQREPQDAAYARAQDAIATARTSDASDLTLSGDDFSDLTELPPDIGTLTALTDLSLSGTQVSDISALSGLTALSFLNLSGTPVRDISVLSGLPGLRELTLSGTSVSDLSPLLPLTTLADAPQSASLAFKNTAAAQAVPGSPKSPRLRTMPSAPPVCLPI
jgi:Leucine-rich repeat (LRR) protein